MPSLIELLLEGLARELEASSCLLSIQVCAPLCTCPYIAVILATHVAVAVSESVQPHKHSLYGTASEYVFMFPSVVWAQCDNSPEDPLSQSRGIPRSALVYRVEQAEFCTRQWPQKFHSRLH